MSFRKKTNETGVISEEEEEPGFAGRISNGGIYKIRPLFLWILSENNNVEPFERAPQYKTEKRPP